MFQKMSRYSSAALVVASLNSAFMKEATANECTVVRDRVIASWYGPGLNGNPTASGDIFHESNLTAATRFLNPHDRERIRVTNLNNGRSVMLIANDNGPFVGGRQVDVSKRGAQELGMVRTGTAPVKVEVCPS